jgi:hypothetical protein
MDATIIESRKQEALRTYEGERGYQPMLAVWAEMDVVLADQFRNGNVQDDGAVASRDELLFSRRLGLSRIRTAAVATGREAGAGSAGVYRVRGERTDDGGLAPGDLASPRRGLGLRQAARQRDWYCAWRLQWKKLPFGGRLASCCPWAPEAHRPFSRFLSTNYHASFARAG